MAETAERTGMPAGAGVRRPNLLPIAVLLVGTVAAYGVIATLALLNGQISAAEVAYLIRSWWYATGVVSPYTATDAAVQMPFYFYQLGFWQQMEGLGQIPARLMSVGFGVLSAALLFIICKRLTANTLAAAAAVFIYLASPATAFYFAQATPTATVAALHLAAVWLIVANLGKQRPWITALMGLLCVALYFYKQSMILAVIVLAPLYIAAIGRKRGLHTAILVAVMAAATAGLVLSFPDKLGAYALRLPVIAPFLEQIGLLSPNFVLIDKGSTGAVTMAPALGRFSPADLLDMLLLPYSGTIILAVALLAVAGGGLRVLWIAPLYFLWLAAAHYVGALGICTRCVADHVPAFSAIGALAAALTLTMLAQRARRHGIPAGPPVLIGAVAAVALNAFAPHFALRDDARGFPIPLMAHMSERADIDTMARWVAANAPPREPILVLHSQGKQKLAALPYTVFLSNHMMPVQSLAPASTRRTLKTNLDAAARESVQAAVEEESLWTDETLMRWLARDYDVVLFQEDKTTDQRAQIAAIAARFDLTASTVFQGATIHLYKRKPVQ
jgi:hypothetical protein